MDSAIQKMMKHLERSNDKSFFFERTVLLERAYGLFRHMERGEMYANTLAYILNHMTIEIRDGERLVSTFQQIEPNEQQLAWYHEKCRENNINLTTLFSFDSMHLWNFKDNPDKYAPEWFCSYGHNVGDYGKVIRMGYLGLKNEAQTKLSEKGLTNKQKLFLTNTIIVCDAMIRFGERYRELAYEMAAKENDEERKQQLMEIVRVCSVSPAKPATTFREALQTLWFTHMVECCVVGCRDYSFGRFDVYMYPYYKADIEAGRLTREEAKYLLEDFCIHNNELTGYICEDVDAKPVLCANSIQYVVLGGTDVNGKDVTNEISYLMLEAMNELPTVKTPDIIVRWHENIDPDYWRFAVTTCAAGRGYPSFFNEKLIENALIKEYKVPENIANSFAYYGCNNIVIAGKEDHLVEAWHNGAKMLELALHRGKCAQTRKQIGPITKEPQEMKSIEDVLEALRQQFAFFLEQGKEDLWKNNQIWRDMKPFSFESVLASDCIVRAKSIDEGGSSYRHYNNHLVGIATIADSLEAIDHLVFQEKKLTMNELLDILAADWKGHEHLQAYVKNKIPKYGNGNTHVDSLAAVVATMFIDEVKKLKDFPNGRIAHASIYSLMHHRPMGQDVGATPDGRNAFTYLSENVSGTYGCENEGPTGILQSSSYLPLSRTVSGAQNIKFQKLFLNGKAGIERLSATIEAYFRMGGTQLQINVVDQEVLKDAQVHPENHKDLMVRVFGFTDYFISLNKEQQQEIVDRDTLKL